MRTGCRRRRRPTRRCGCARQLAALPFAALRPVPSRPASAAPRPPRPAASTDASRLPLADCALPAESGEEADATLQQRPEPDSRPAPLQGLRQGYPGSIRYPRPAALPRCPRSPHAPPGEAQQRPEPDSRRPPLQGLRQGRAASPTAARPRSRAFVRDGLDLLRRVGDVIVKATAGKRPAESVSLELDSVTWTEATKLSEAHESNCKAAETNTPTGGAAAAVSEDILKKQLRRAPPRPAPPRPAL
eukprot:tig00021137_g18980.t1